MSNASPCSTCPYRRSAPIGLWDSFEFDKLRRHDADEMGGNTFGCHLDDGSMCRGWLADQKRRGVPSIRLRLHLMSEPATVAVFKAIDADDPDLFNSIAEMCDANEGRTFPKRSKKALKVVRRLSTLRR